MKYYVATKEGKVISHGMNPDNVDGFISRSSEADQETVFDDFKKYKKHLKKFQIDVQDIPCAEESYESEVVEDVVINPQLLEETAPVIIEGTIGERYSVLPQLEETENIPQGE